MVSVRKREKERKMEKWKCGGKVEKESATCLCEVFDQVL